MNVWTEGRHPGEFIINEARGTFCREVITIPAGTGVVEPNTVIGQVAATKKWKPSSPAATDGSEVGKGVAIYGCDATAADQKVAAFVRGPAEVNGNFLVFDASVDTPAEKSAKIAELAAVGIVVR